MELLTRDEFRKKVFERDSYKCVICKNPADAAHHIIERRLFPDGGYYVGNGASLCPQHHIEAERTTLSCKQIREAAGIQEIIIPPYMYDDEEYDKWGNIILNGGRRSKGELFFDESVQIILLEGGVLNQFDDYVKYPRTHHFSWSPGIGKKDRILTDTSAFHGKRVIATVKEDGENTNMYPDKIHARSIDTKSHESRDWVRNLHARIKYNIPTGYRICGENLYAKHTIFYDNLEDYFLLFSVWNDRNICLSWDETLEWAELFGLKTVPVLYDGIWDETIIRNLYKPTYNGCQCEGYVVRIADSFRYGDFRRVVAKYVRAGHVQTHAHWMHSYVEPNILKD